MVEETQKNQQEHQDEWHYQWDKYKTQAHFLFFDWIQPRTLQDFDGKMVLDAGCGAGHHVQLVASAATHVTGVDLNASDVARTELSAFDNVTTLEGDIARFQPEEQLDIVYCVGVIHHTDDPDFTFDNLKKMVKPGGLLIIWCYSKEGNELVWKVVEPLRRRFLSRASRKMTVNISWLLTALMYPAVYTLYLLPLKKLPFYEYFQNFRKLSFYRNFLNVFDKLNAPQTDFISRERIESWFSDKDFTDISITPYCGVSWRGSARLRSGSAK